MLLKPSERYNLELSSHSETHIRNHNMEWFNKFYIDRKEKPRDMTKVEPFILGRMYTFLYDDPKYKEELDFYTILPISLFIGYSKNAQDNPMMVNVHFIPPQIRMSVLDKIWEINKYKINFVEHQVGKGNISNRPLDTTYYDLQKWLINSGYGFAIRSYIKERIKTEPLIISYNDWWRILTFANQGMMKKGIMYVYNEYKKNLDPNWRPFIKEKKIKL